MPTGDPADEMNQTIGEIWDTDIIEARNRTGWDVQRITATEAQLNQSVTFRQLQEQAQRNQDVFNAASVRESLRRLHAQEVPWATTPFELGGDAILRQRALEAADNLQCMRLAEISNRMDASPESILTPREKAAADRVIEECKRLKLTGAHSFRVRITNFVQSVFQKRIEVGYSIGNERRYVVVDI